MRQPATPSPPSKPAPIEFWFDFASAYGFFAAMEIEALGRRVGREVDWRPFILGTAFKTTGMRGLSSTPLKKDYALRDWQRIARLKGVHFALPQQHPSVALAATRAFYCMNEKNPERAKAFARAVLHAYFTRGIDLGNIDEVAGIAELQGAGRAALIVAASDERIKARVREISESAVAAGIFGSPFFIADGEPFWGWDRMDMMEQWIRTGGW